MAESGQQDIRHHASQSGQAGSSGNAAVPRIPWWHADGVCKRRDYQLQCLSQSIRPWAAPFRQWSEELSCCTAFWMRARRLDRNWRFWHSALERGEWTVKEDAAGLLREHAQPANPVLSPYAFFFLADHWVQNGEKQVVPQRSLRSNWTLLFAANGAWHPEVDIPRSLAQLTRKRGKDAIMIWIDDYQPFDVSDQTLFGIPHLRRLFTTAQRDVHPRVSAHPLGTTLPSTWASLLWRGQGWEASVGQRRRLLHCSALTIPSKGAGAGRRRKVEALRANGFTCEPTLRVSTHEFATLLLTSKFVMSPWGNGRKNHRDVETWMSGAVPLLDFDPNEPPGLYSELPSVTVRNWSSVTPALLEQEWARIQQAAREGAYDLRKAFFPYWFGRVLTGT